MRLVIDFAAPRGGAGFKNLIDGSERNGVALGHNAALPRMPMANGSPAHFLVSKSRADRAIERPVI